MRIARVTSRIVDLDRLNAIFVEVETDTGLTGAGETVMKRHDRTVAAHLDELGDYLVGRDPVMSETIAEQMYRDSFWVGGPLQAAARSALDIALWDIKGQHLGAPVYEMLGGPTRSSIPAYTHLPLGGSPADFAATVANAVAAGHRAAKIGYLPLATPQVTETELIPTSYFDKFARYLAAARDRVGWDFELMIDCHGRFSLANAKRLADALAPFKLLWIEEPLPPEAVEEYAQLTAHSPVPIAAGERLGGLYEARRFLQARAVSVLQCDVVNCGGITGAKKIAALAEAYFTPLAPHNPNGPIATLATAHLLMSIPNAYILESAGSDPATSIWGEVVDNPPLVSDGQLKISGRPGIGAKFLPVPAHRTTPKPYARNR
jgi:galactonate dehydratase